MHLYPQYGESFHTIYYSFPMVPVLWMQVQTVQSYNLVCNFKMFQYSSKNVKKSHFLFTQNSTCDIPTQFVILLQFPCFNKLSNDTKCDEFYWPKSNLTPPPPPPKFSQRIWRIHKNGLWQVHFRGIPPFRGTLTCLQHIGDAAWALSCSIP